jgi:hypothetical protein
LKRSEAELVLRAIDEGLRSVLGESATEALYRHFEKRTGLKKEELLKKPGALEAFDCFLKGLFNAGYKVLEKAVLSSLYKRLGLPTSSLSEVATLLSQRSQAQILPTRRSADACEGAQKSARSSG